MTPIDQFYRQVAEIPGAISMTEAVALYNAIVAYSPGIGIAVDLGSNTGKSSLVAARALCHSRFDGRFYMVDLAYDLSNPEWSKTVQGDSAKMPWPQLRDAEYLKSIKERMAEYVDAELVGQSSIQFIPRMETFAGYVFIDTDDHQKELVMEEARLLENRTAPGGLIFFHDFKNQYTGPALAHQYLLDTGKFENIEMPWDQAIEYVKKRGLEEGNDSWHMSGSGIEFPNFIGCVRAL